MQTELASLTFPRYHKLLTGQREDVVPVKLEESGRILGLALICLPKVEPSVAPSAHMLSIMVVPDRRRSGIARELIRRAEQAAHDNGRETISTWYSTRLPMRAAFESLLAGSGWNSPLVESMRTAGYAVAVAAEMDRIELARRSWLPEGAVIDLWSTVTEDERPEIDCLAEAIDFSNMMHPGKWEKFCHPELSVVLRLNGHIAGWVFGEAPTPELCYYAVGYVVPELRRRGALIGLIRDVCRRQAALYGPASVARLSTTPATPGMPRFMKERLGRCALWYDEYMSVSKNLTEEPAHA